MKIGILLSLIVLLVACDKDKHIHNHFSSSPEESSEEVRTEDLSNEEDKKVESLGQLSIQDYEIPLPVYSSSMVLLVGKIMKCQLSYERSNFERKIPANTLFSVKRDFYYVKTGSNSKATGEMSYKVSFHENEFGLKKLDCDISNALEAFKK